MIFQVSLPDMPVLDVESKCEQPTEQVRWCTILQVLINPFKKQLPNQYPTKNYSSNSKPLRNEKPCLKCADVQDNPGATSGSNDANKWLITPGRYSFEVVAAQTSHLLVFSMDSQGKALEECPIKNKQPFGWPINTPIPLHICQDG